MVMSRVAQGSRHCISVCEASLQTQVHSRTVSQLAVIGSPIVRHTIGPVSSGLGEDLARGGFTGSWRYSDAIVAL